MGCLPQCNAALAAPLGVDSAGANFWLCQRNLLETAHEAR